MSRLRLSWRGAAVRALVRAAEEEAVQATLLAALDKSYDDTPVDTGFLINTMEVTEDAHRVGNGVRGSFGNTTADYTFFVEVGTVNTPPHLMLTTAAEVEFPRLPERIRRAM